MRLLSALGAVLICAGCSPQEGAPAAGARVLDLTQALTSDIPMYPGGKALEITLKADLRKDGYFMNSIAIGEHTGTHVDAPRHFIEGGWTVDAIPADRLVGPGVVLDFRASVKTDPDARLSRADIVAWEAAHGRVPKGAIVLVRTGWSARWSQPERYLNRGKDGVFHFPGVSVEAAKMLGEERGVAGVGIDTLSIDYGPSKGFEAHKVLHAARAFHIENVADMEGVPAVGATIVVAPLPIKGGSGSPCRIFALVGG